MPAAPLVNNEASELVFKSVTLSYRIVTLDKILHSLGVSYELIPLIVIKIGSGVIDIEKALRKSLCEGLFSYELYGLSPKLKNGQ